MSKTATKIKNWTVLLLRTSVLILTSVYYLVEVLIKGGEFTYSVGIIIALILVWAEFVMQSLLKLLGVKIAPLGATKHLKRNYAPTGVDKTPKGDKKKTIAIALMWGVAVTFFALGKFIGFLDEGLLILAFLALLTLDGLSVHFFCPFRVFVMKNKCCNTCRIYNWDGLMIASPLYFVHNVFSYILVGLVFILFVWWEIAYRLHPERFFEETNGKLRCSNCKNSTCPRKIK